MNSKICVDYKDFNKLLKLALSNCDSDYKSKNSKFKITNFLSNSNGNIGDIQSIFNNADKEDVKSNKGIKYFCDAELLVIPNNYSITGQEVYVDISPTKIINTNGNFKLVTLYPGISNLQYIQPPIYGPNIYYNCSLTVTCKLTSYSIYQLPTPASYPAVFNLILSNNSSDIRQSFNFNSLNEEVTVNVNGKLPISDNRNMFACGIDCRSSFGSTFYNCTILISQYKFNVTQL